MEAKITNKTPPSNKNAAPNQKKIWRLFEDYPTLQLLDSDHEGGSDIENSLNVVHTTS